MFYLEALYNTDVTKMATLVLADVTSKSWEKSVKNDL